MDTNLDDSLNLDSAMGVDFEHSEDVTVGQSDLTGLDHTDHEESIPMEFHHIEEQPIIMDTGNEEIIVSDFMGDFPVQSIPECQFGMTDTTVMDDSNDQITFISHGEQKGEEVEYDSHIPVPASGMIIEEMNKKPQIIKVKAARMANMRPIAAKKETVVVTKTTAPRQVAIAPKPPALVDQGVFHKFKTHKVIGPGKQFAIAPKPMSNRGVSLVKKLALPATSVASQGKPITQLGHKLVMVPASAGQKIKLVAAGGTGSVTLISTGDADQAQLIQSDGNNTLTQGTKPVLAKVIMQGGEGGPTPTLLTKLMPAGAGAAPVKYVTMQQKTVPISINKKVVIASPTKQGVRFATAKKQQIIAIRSPTPKLMPATTAASAAVTKKVVISASQAQNFVFKAATSVAKTGQLTKVINTSGQKTQFHQINVPGKGVQYIRLVTNPAVKPLVKPFVLTDSKGNLIQMTTDKVGDSQPPPLVVTGNINKLTAKPQQKLVTIAPLTSKTTQTAMDHAKGRRYATIKALAPSPPPSLEVELPPLVDDSHDLGLRPYAKSIKEETDSKAALQALIADTVGDDMQNDDLNEQQVDFEPPQGQSPPLDVGSAGAGTGAGGEHPLIVIPSEYYKQAELTILPDDNTSPDPHRGNEMMKIEVDPYKDFNQSPVEYPPSEPDMVSTELGLRPRKACNCTKSQCLKLYCDCFANGEFCNRCNCNNCHNNLDNEELRQKAIRGCLDRNPNAFRPKIGKAKSGGPDIIRRHNKGCNCKRSGCLKNYCECYEAKIACTAICKCVGCRNVEDSLERALRREPRERPHQPAPSSAPPSKQPCSFMTTEVIEAVCQCLLAAAAEGGSSGSSGPGGSSGPSRSSGEPVRDVVEEFARCLQEIISAAHHHQPAAPHNSSLSLLDETHA